MQQRYVALTEVCFVLDLKLWQFRPICVGAGQMPGPGIDEDCLFVNIFTPSGATPDSKLPVWVWIQGGGYSTNSNANYNGTEVIQSSGNNVIFVNFNYRVGVFGFLGGEEVREDGDLNAGLLDQRLLLRWVQKHIHKVSFPLHPWPFYGNF